MLLLLSRISYFWEHLSVSQEKSHQKHEWERYGYSHLFSMNWEKIFPYIRKPSLLNRVLGVLACSRALCVYMLACFACLRACVLTCLECLRAYVLERLRASVVMCLVCFRAWRAYVLLCLMCFRVYVLLMMKCFIFLRVCVLGVLFYLICFTF